LPKRRNVSRKHSNRFTASEILTLFRDQSGPLSWRQLIDLTAADEPRAITQLRQMLKGLERSGELERDHQGAYHLPDSGPVQEALVHRSGKNFTANGAVIDDPQRFSLREGDAVEIRVVNGQARVLRVISHADTPVTGVLRKRGRYPYVEGIGSYRGRVSLLEPPQSGEDGDTVHVRIVDRDRRGLVGLVEDVLSHDSVLEQAIATAVASAQIPHEWPPAVTAAAEKLPGSVNPKRYPGRRDLTGLPLVTIDGETAQDFDDAVYAEPGAGKSGGYRLVVAIADVGHYVKRGSALDLEAVQRGTSVYFPTTVIPMLPERISNGLCSLRPHTARLALVCDMQIDDLGQTRQYEFYEAVIFSHARLTYEQVQAFIDGEDELPVEPEYEDQVCGSVRALQQLHTLLRQARDERGALDFATREGQLELQAGRVASIKPVLRLQAHQLIEEAMIAANVSAACFLEDHETPALYRVHEPPDPDKVEELRHALAYAGVRLAPGDVAPKALQSALSRLPEHADQWLYAQLALRTLQQAVYSPRNQGHYGLALERYMHFTSPIRRYSDLVVHRAIKAVLARQAAAKTAKIPGMDELHLLGEQCSSNERRAESAGWLVDAWLKCDYLLPELGAQFEGVIAGVTEFGLFVELQGYFVQGLLHISNLGEDYFMFEARAMALVGERSGRRFGLGDHLDVIIRDIDPPQGKIDLVLARSSSKQGRRGRKGKRRKDRPRAQSPQSSSKPA